MLSTVEQDVVECVCEHVKRCQVSGRCGLQYKVSFDERCRDFTTDNNGDHTAVINSIHSIFEVGYRCHICSMHHTKTAAKMQGNDSSF